jgi:hypothetical protein
MSCTSFVKGLFLLPFLIPLVVGITSTPFFNTIVTRIRIFKKITTPHLSFLIEMTCLGKFKALIFHKLQICSYFRTA